MNSIRRVLIGDVLTLAREPVTVEPDASYRLAGVYGFGRGIFEGKTITGSETKYSRLFRIHAGQIVYSRLKAFEGAFGLVPPNLDGCFVSSEFPTYQVDESLLLPRFLECLVRSPRFAEKSRLHSQGVGARRERLGESSFERIEIALPSLQRQREVINIYERSLFADVSRGALDFLTLCGSSVSRLVMLGDYCDAELCPLGELMQLRRTPVKVDAAEQYVEIGIRSFGRGVFRKPSVSGSEILTKRVFKVQCSDLLLSNVFSWEGAISVANDAVANCIGSHRFLTYVPRLESVEPNYLRAYLLSDQGLAKIRAASPGSAGRNRTLNINLLEKVGVPLPPIHIQRQVAERFAALQRLVELREKRRRLAEALPQSVLNEELGEL